MTSTLLKTPKTSKQSASSSLPGVLSHPSLSISWLPRKRLAKSGLMIQERCSRWSGHRSSQVLTISASWIWELKRCWHPKTRQKWNSLFLEEFWAIIHPKTVQWNSDLNSSTLDSLVRSRWQLIRPCSSPTKYLKEKCLLSLWSLLMIPKSPWMIVFTATLMCRCPSTSLPLCVKQVSLCHKLVKMLKPSLRPLLRKRFHKNSRIVMSKSQQLWRVSATESTTPNSQSLITQCRSRAPSLSSLLACWTFGGKMTRVALTLMIFSEI